MIDPRNLDSLIMLTGILGLRHCDGSRVADWRSWCFWGWGCGFFSNRASSSCVGSTTDCGLARHVTLPFNQYRRSWIDSIHRGPIHATRGKLDLVRLLLGEKSTVASIWFRHFKWITIWVDCHNNLEVYPSVYCTSLSIKYLSRCCTTRKSRG